MTADRIATALERIADALERAHPKFNPGGYVGGDYTIPEMPIHGYGRLAGREEIRAVLDAKPCDDRTCTDRDHWAPESVRTVTLRGPNQCEPGCLRPALHGGDCDAVGVPAARVPWDGCESGAGDARPNLIVSTTPDPMDEDDHRPRHDTEGDHWTWRRADRWCSRNCSCDGVWTMPEIVGQFGPLTFCDCDPTDSDRATA